MFSSGRRKLGQNKPTRSICFRVLLPGFFLGLLLLLFIIAMNLMGNMSESAHATTHLVLQPGKLDQPSEVQTSVSSKNTKLRFDWTNLPVQSKVGKMFDSYQKSCDIPLANYPFRNRFGLGSDLHVWTQAVCNAMAQNVRIRSTLPWIWFAERSCDDADASSPMLCYFPKAELQCPNDEKQVSSNEIATNLTRRQGYRCDETPLWKDYKIPEIRAGGIEYLFQSVSQLVIDEAERQLNNVFPDGAVPPDLITVQVRWGDKKVEMGVFVEIEAYIEGVHRLLEARKAPVDKANIFLATEDPLAVAAFEEKAPKGWKVFVDSYHTQLKSIRGTVEINHTKGSNYNENPRVSMTTKGQAGLVAIASLLVSMEANDFVLTTSSNWSRLMDELRKNVVNPRCNGCTNMVDLLGGEW